MERSLADGYELSEEVLANESLEAFAEDISSSPRTANRQPFISLSQVDADHALARALQQQEHAYLLLQFEGDGSGPDTSGSGTADFGYVAEEVNEQGEVPELFVQQYKEDADSVEADEGGMDWSANEIDEAYAQALQDAEYRDAAIYMMGLVGAEADGEYENGSYAAQDGWQDVDPDNMSYEELVALGDAVGIHSRGLKPDVIAALPYSKYAHNLNSCTSSEELCVICRMEYEEGDCLSTLPCKHLYHIDCIKNWLQINKACPICSVEVPS